MLNDLIEEYKKGSHGYCRQLTSDEAKDREYAHHEEKLIDIVANLHPVHFWISQAESQGTGQLKRASSKGSTQS